MIHQSLTGPTVIWPTGVPVGGANPEPITSRVD